MLEALPGTNNPADIPSQERTLPELADDDLWLHGPSWLLCKSFGPENDAYVHSDIPDECWKETKKDVYELLTTQYYGVSNLIEIEQYSNLNHLIRVMTHVKSFIQRLRRLTTPIWSVGNTMG